MSREGPHSLVLWLHAEIHPLNKHGECAGDPALREKREILIPACDLEAANAKWDAIEEFLGDLRNA